MKYNFLLPIAKLMKKSKYQQYIHSFIVCIPGTYAFWFRFWYNIVTALIRVVFRGAAFIRGRRVFQCQYSKVRRLLEGDTYLRPGAY